MSTPELSHPHLDDPQTHERGVSFEEKCSTVLQHRLGNDRLIDGPNSTSVLSQIATGSKRLDERTDFETRQGVLQAREDFFGKTLGWGDPAHPLYQSLKKFKDGSPKIVPIDTFINTQFELTSLGIDPVKTLKTLPAMIGLSPEGVREKIDNLRKIGLDPVRTINSIPVAISYSLEGVREKIENLRELGLNYVKIINTHPAAISLSPEGARKKVENFRELGLDPVRIVNTYPAALSLSPEGVREKIDNLRKIGLDPIHIINTHPAAIGLSPEGVRKKIENLRELGLNPINIIDAHPAVISLSPVGVRTKIQSLIELGIISSGAEIQLDSKSQITSFFTLPIESLLMYISHVPAESIDLGRIATDARRFVETQVGRRTLATEREST